MRKTISFKKSTFLILLVFTIILSGCNSQNTNNLELNNESDLEDTVNLDIKITIKDKVYNIILDDNETAKAFVSLLPLEINMQELNGNEKYYYLDTKLPTSKERKEEIKKGDLMIYEDNCLVLFYKTFSTNYSYTKIGNISNLSNLEDGNVTVRFER